MKKSCTKLKVAVVQMVSTNDKDHNLKQAVKLISSAVKNRAELIALPEVFNFRGTLSEIANESEAVNGKSISILTKLSKEKKVWILAGSFMESRSELKTSKSKKPYNTSILLDPNGKINAKYRKIHLFDMKYKGQEILESSRNERGEKPVLGKIKDVKVGMSICYDLRFPELYRYYSSKGAEMLFVPSAFTKITGQVHWHTLLKARAIENQCYVLAPNQAGMSTGGIKTYGHSLIIDPWGEIISEAPEIGEKIIYADLCFEHLNSIRNRLPSLKHRKL